MAVTTPEVDERLHAKAVAAAINAPLEATDDETTRCFEYSDVPGSDQVDDADARRAPLPDIFLLLAVERRYSDPQRMGGAKAGRSSWRVTVEAVGRTVNEARWALLQATTALEEQRLTVGDHLTTALRFESATAIQPDNHRRQSGSITWTYST